MFFEVLLFQFFWLVQAINEYAGDGKRKCHEHVETKTSSTEINFFRDKN